MKLREAAAVNMQDAELTDGNGSKIDSEMLLENVQRIAKQSFDGARGSHDWEHTLRVFRLCRRIGSKEGADMDVLLVAAYLHDIGRGFQDASNGAVCHAQKGVEIAIPIVSALPLTEKQKENIVHCVRSHRFRGNYAPQTIEAKILFDADKLDAIGAVGVARAFLFAGEVGARLHSPKMNVEEAAPYSKDDTGYREYRVKLSKVRDRILTKTGRELADERHDVMEQFFKRFIKEYEGER
jgi:uncharacterized protein